MAEDIRRAGYHGFRNDDGTAVVVVIPIGKPRRQLDPRLDLRNHSPTGFEWGYGGSGPAQLALAICADVLRDDERALRVYQEFKRRAVAVIPQNSAWLLHDCEILSTIEDIEQG